MPRAAWGICNGLFCYEKSTECKIRCPGALAPDGWVRLSPTITQKWRWNLKYWLHAKTKVTAHQSHALLTLAVVTETLKEIKESLIFGEDLIWRYTGEKQRVHLRSGPFFLFSSVQFSHSVVSNSLRPHESKHARPPCPSPTPRVHSDSRPSSRWCHPAISSSVAPFSSCPQSLPALESFPMSQLFTWGAKVLEFQL